MKAAILRWFTRLMDAKAACRPMWIEEPPLIVRCAWHEDLSDPINAEASHSICDACRVKFEGGAAA